MNKPAPISSDLKDQARSTRTSSAGWMLQRLACVTDGRMQARLKEHGLKMDHFIVLMTLAEREGASQTKLGEGLRIAGYTVSRALDALEAQGLVERRQDEQSRRTHQVYLTPSGRELMPRLFDIIAAHNEALLAPLAADDQREFVRLLALLTESAEGMPCGGDERG